MSANSGWRRRATWSAARIQEHRCGRKIPYQTWVEARQAILELMSRGDDGKGPMDAYECVYCGQYHVGHGVRKTSE